MYRRILFILPIFLILLSACVPFIGNIQLGLETPTSPALAPPSETATPVVVPTEAPDEPTPVSSTGTVSGRVCYPSEFIPAMTVYFQQTPSGTLTEISIAENQATYTVELVPGIYRAFAWVEDYQLGGAYTTYVACGFVETCLDHALQSFPVQIGQNTPHIDLCDWPIRTDQLPIPHQGGENDPMLGGMMYSTQEGEHFRIGSNGIASSLYGGQGMAISPDGTRGLYPQNNDLFIINLTTGEQVNLTNTSNTFEVLYQWPIQDRIFFTALPEGDGGGPGSTGGLYSIHPDGSGFTAIDAETNAGNFAVSLDGRFVAYGAGPTAFIYDLELNQRGIFDPTSFGISSPNGLSVSSPAWSPNGQKLAWMTQGDFNGQGAFAAVIYDLSTTTFEIIHPYQIVGMDGFLPPVRFSSDGKWIAFQAFEADASQNGVWIVRIGDPNQSTEMFVGTFSSNPYWSPDGRWVAFHQYLEAQQAQKVFLYDRETNNIYQILTLPLNTNVIDWK